MQAFRLRTTFFIFKLRRAGELVFSVVVFFVFALWFFISGPKKTALKDNGVLANGMVVSNSLVNDNAQFKYMFQVSGVQYEGTGSGSKCVAIMNDSITIIYLPDDPFESSPACDILGDDVRVKYCKVEK